MGSSNRSLTISVLIDPPAAMPCALDRYCPQRGIVFEIAQIMCKKLHFDCTYISANTTLYGYSENGTWKGVVGDVVAGRVDTSLPRFTPTQQRAEVVDFSSAYFYEQMLLVTRLPEQGAHEEKLNLIHAFGMGVWICIAVVILLAGLLMSNTILFKRSMSFIEDYFVKRLHTDLLFTGKHGCIWTISAAALILTRAYTGYLFTVRMAGESEKPFYDLDSFATCIQTKKCNMILKTGSLSYVYQLLDTNKSELFTHLKTALQVNPLQTMALADVPERILNEKSTFNAAIIWDTDFYYAVSKYNPCDFYYISAGLLPGPNTFPLPKNWTHKREMDKLGTQINENGIVSEIMSRYKIHELRKCQQKVGVNWDTLGFLIDIFIFLIAGESLAVLCFIIERMKPKRTLRLPVLFPMSLLMSYKVRNDKDR